MTERRKRFVDNYIATANATEAAKRAGYSKKTAYSIGENLLHDKEVRAAIDRRLKELESDRIAETKELLEHLTAVVRDKVTEEVVTASGKKFTVKVREQDKLKAVEMLLKVKGEFREKVDVKMDTTQLLISTLEKICGDDKTVGGG